MAEWILDTQGILNDVSIVKNSETNNDASHDVSMRATENRQPSTAFTVGTSAAGREYGSSSELDQSPQDSVFSTVQKQHTHSRSDKGRKCNYAQYLGSPTKKSEGKNGHVTIRRSSGGPLSVTQDAQPSGKCTDTYIFITACLQCALKNLPCDKALPGCSRCVRAGQGDLCLPQREELEGEDKMRDVWEDSIPLFLKMRGKKCGQNAKSSKHKRQLQEEVSTQNFVLKISAWFQGLPRSSS